MASSIAPERGSMAEAATFLRTIAGAEANVAAGLARLGRSTAYIGRVGDDPLGTTITRTLRGEGVHVGHLRVDADATTGVMFRELRDVGAAEVVYWRAGSAGSRISAVDVSEAASLFHGARWLHLSGITPALSADAEGAVETALELARASGLTISFDLNIRRRLWSERKARPVLAGLAARADIVLGGLDEVAVVAGLADSLEAGNAVDAEAAADVLLGSGPSTVVVKLGAGGALERRRVDGKVRTTNSPAHLVPVVADPVGAGDASTAGYIAARLDDLPAVEALAMANACGAAAVASVGDQAGLPTRTELDRLLVSGGPDTLR
jgi:2-dehydro-3-deoxygluconokinase